MNENPASRIEAHDALNHSFFKDHDLMPTTKDMVLLPSHILQLYNVFKDEKYKDPKEVEGKSSCKSNYAFSYENICKFC